MCVESVLERHITSFIVVAIVMGTYLKNYVRFLKNMLFSFFTAKSS